MVLSIAFAGGAFAKPAVVSLDYCADQYLLALAGPEQILGVSRGADKDYSFMRDRARAHHKIRASQEEVLILNPDVVLRQWGGGGDAARAFGRFGANVVSLGYPTDFSGVRENIRLAAKALDQVERGERLIVALDKELNALKKNRPINKVRALYFTPGGVTAGAHTMIDAIMAAAGVENIAAANGAKYWPPLPAEALIRNPPELIVAGFFDVHSEKINYWSAARHPALKSFIEENPNVTIPADLIGCAGWYSVIAAQRISRAAQAKVDGDD